MLLNLLQRRQQHCPPKTDSTRDLVHSSRGPEKRKRKKSKWQLKLESQERANMAAKNENKAKREAAKAQKEAKLMKPKKEDVSQLEEQFQWLNSSD